MLYLNIPGHEEKFFSLSKTPYFVNDMDLKTTEGRKRLQSLIYTEYSGDHLSVLPTCDCGEISGNYKLGVYHRACDSYVVSSTERKIESSVWMRVPNDVTAFINPVIYNILVTRFSPSGVNLIDWLCNPRLVIPDHKVAVHKMLKGFDFPRGYNNFIQHFDAIIPMLVDMCKTNDNIKKMNELLAFIRMFRQKVFTRYLPLPSKIGFIIENTANRKYSDVSSAPAIDAMKTIASIDNSVKPLSVASKELRVFKAVTQLAAFYDNFCGDIISPKKGIFRQQVYGGRLHFTMRAVITSITEPHQFDEIHLPWSHSVQLFKVHLTSKLLKLNYAPAKIQRILLHAVNNYTPLIDGLFKEIIAEAGPRGYGCLMNRNPSLERGSAQFLNITKVKPNPKILTISAGALILVAFNADLTKLRRRQPSWKVIPTHIYPYINSSISY